MLFYVLHHPMEVETHNISPGGVREVFRWGSGGWEAEACTRTTRSIAQILVEVVCNVLSHLYDFGSRPITHLYDLHVD